MRVWQAIQAAADNGSGPRRTEQGADPGERGGGGGGSGPGLPDEGGAQ
jgi:hypothetical protein